MFRKLLNRIHLDARDQRGQTFVEYALLLVGISVGLLAAFGPLDEALGGLIADLLEVIP